MAYIGKEPIVGNFQVCDAISVVNGQAAYTMQVSSTNVTPESANHMLVSLNGILQKPNSSFTVSGSTITFASNLATGDVIDFIMLLGNVLDIGTPSDSTVTDAKANFVSTSSGAGLQIKGDGTTDGTLQLNCSQNTHGIKLKSPAHSTSSSYTLTFPGTDPSSDKFLKTDGSGNLSFADAGGGEWTKILHTTASSSANVAFNSTYITNTYQDYKIVFSNVHPASDNVYFNSYFSDDNGSSNLTLDSVLRGYKDDGTLSTRSDNTGNDYFRLQTNETLGNDTGLSIGGFLELIAPYKNDTRTFMFGRSFANIGDSQFAFFHNLYGAGTLGYTAMNYIKFQFSSGNIATGEFTLYGRKIT
jgi:hypothetical protein